MELLIYGILVKRFIMYKMEDNAQRTEGEKMKKVLVLMMCFMFVGAGSVLAEVDLKEHTTEIGTEVSYIKYEEPGLMEESGMMYGLYGSYTYRFSNVMLRADGKWSYGQVDYKSSGSGNMNNIDDYMVEFRGVVGYDFPMHTASLITPYIGFGYRYLNDDLIGTTSTGASGYERESNYYYTPIGIETITELEDGWSIGLIVEYDYFWQGVQDSHLSDAGLGLNDISNDQNDGYGLRASIKAHKKGDTIDLTIEPFIRYWDINQSETTAITAGTTIVGSGFEPANESTEIGLKVALNF